MNNLQHSKVQMCTLVFRSLNKHRDIVDGLPWFTENEKVLTDSLDEILNSSTVQQENRTGPTALKNDWRANLVREVMGSTRKLLTFAEFTGNILLKKSCNMTPSRIGVVSAGILRDYAQLMYDKGQEFLPDLEKYGINEQSQRELRNAIDAFWASLSDTRERHNEFVRNTKRVSDLFKKINKSLRAMDMAIEIVRNTHPDFYDEYKVSRRITQQGTGSLALKGTVTDALTGEPIKGVTITFTEVDNVNRNKALTVLVKKSADKGGYFIKNMPTGTYAYKAMKNGYNIHDGMIVVGDDPRQVLNIVLSMN